MVKLIRYIIILMLSGYVVWLHSIGKLTLYIHWRYETFTFIFGTFAAFLSVIGIIRTLEVKGFSLKKIVTDSKIERSDLGGILVLVVILLIAVTLPPSSLSVEAAAQRQIDFNVIDLETSSAAELFLSDTKSLNMGDWVTSLAYDPNPQHYLEKEVSIEGFALTNDSSVPDDMFKLSRFVLTCCVVDARPVGLLVSNAEELTKIEQGDWYQVSGRFALVNDELVIVPESINKIDEPEEPYLL